MLFIAAMAVVVPYGAVAQNILTAEDFFDQISDQYAQIQDYVATVHYRIRADEWTGELNYRRPNLLRIDFSDPAEQVFNTDGQFLIIYVPRHRVAFRQELGGHGAAVINDMASEQGLHMLRQNYSIAYVTGPEPVPLEEDSEEMVVKLKLEWLNTSENYRQLEIAVNEDMMIRRITGVTVDYETVQMDFLDIGTNEGIPEARFEYDPPASANWIDNFLGLEE
jgi:outer membrane lipoprotein-sorting protein